MSPSPCCTRNVLRKPMKVNQKCILPSRMLTRHPGLVRAFGSYIVFGPGKAGHDDCGLAIFEAAGFAEAQADQARPASSRSCSAAADSFMKKLSRDGGNAEELMRESMAKAAEVAGQYPPLASAPGNPVRRRRRSTRRDLRVRPRGPSRRPRSRLPRGSSFGPATCALRARFIRPRSNLDTPDSRDRDDRGPWSP